MLLKQKTKQQEGQKAAILDADIVITTAQLFGRKPPVLITEDVVKDMRKGSVIVDMAAMSGGNVEGSIPGKTIQNHGIHIIGDGRWPEYVARAATDMYTNNIINFIEEFLDKENNVLNIDFEDDIIKGSVITHHGKIVNEMLLNAYQENAQ